MKNKRPVLSVMPTYHEVFGEFNPVNGWTKESIMRLYRCGMCYRVKGDKLQVCSEIGESWETVGIRRR